MMSCSGDIPNFGDDSGSAGTMSGCDSIALDREVREVTVVSNFELGHVSMADEAHEGPSTMVVERSALIDRDDDVSSSDVECEEPSRPLGFLVSNPPFKFIESDLVEIRYKYGIPESVQLRVPKKYKRPDWLIPGRTCFYELPFKQGLRLPVPRLAHRVLDFFDLAPSQLMSNAWRLLLSVEHFCKIHGIDFDLPDLFHSYYLKMHDTERGRYNFCLRPHKLHLVVGLTTNDRYWKTNYFFAKGDLVKHVVRCLTMQSFWNSTVGLDSVHAIESGHSVERTRAILSFNEEDRHWKTVLAESSLRSSVLWKHSTLNVGAKRRAIERKAKGKKKTNQLEQPHVLADEVITPPLGFLCIKDKNALELSAKKRMLETSTEGDDGLITLSLPPDASAFSDFGSISGQVKHLLLSENAARFSKMGATKAVEWCFANAFQMFQGQLYMKNELVSSTKNIRDLRSSNGKLRADVELLRTEVDQLKVANTEARHVADAEAAKAWASGYELARLKDDFEEKKKRIEG
ncbi:hypothetical protein ACOSP7_027035 [Xanthoceras sorbifolium]